MYRILLELSKTPFPYSKSKTVIINYVRAKNVLLISSTITKKINLLKITN